MATPRFARHPALAFLVALSASAGGSTGRAATFHVDPQRGSPDGDGSAARPWRTLQEVIEANLIRTRTWEHLPPDENTPLVEINQDAPVGPGDTILLGSGYHGEIEIVSWYNELPIVIAPEPGARPQVGSIHIQGGANWVFRGMEISPSFSGAQGQGSMVFLENHGWRGPVHDVTIEDCTLFTVEDASDWSAADWNTRAWDGIQSQGANVEIRNNHLKNVNFGISVSGPDTTVSGNVIENFAGDGMRGLGDYGVFEYNVVKNCYDVNENHDDGFQSWSVGPDGVGSGEVVGVVLRGNVIINFEDPNQPHRGTLQGIGCFDGVYRGWRVENNLVVVDHYHGITFYGCVDCVIVNNTVWDQDQTNDVGPTWIMLHEAKDGRPTTGTVLRNNLAARFLGTDLDGVTADHNLVVDDPAVFFADPARLDFHLAVGSPAIDSGSPDLAPATDIEGVPRPQGEAVDVGAYEYHEGPVTYPDGGPAVDSGPGVDAGPDAETGPDGAPHLDAGPDGGARSGPGQSGCGCRAARGKLPAWLLVGLFLLFLRRRRGREKRPGPR